MKTSKVYAVISTLAFIAGSTGGGAAPSFGTNYTRPDADVMFGKIRQTFSASSP